MRFPLGDWIDEHLDCRHNLGESGMRGSVEPHPLPQRTDRGVLDELKDELGRSVGVDPGRVFLTHGATEANAWVAFYLRAEGTGRSRACRVRRPEYPPLVDVTRAAGFRPTADTGPARLAVVSQPGNPEGDLWDDERLFAWADGARAVLVDETFREFAGTRSRSVPGQRGLWTSGTFTKFFGADHLRVGFVVAPPEEADRFGTFVGLVTDELAPAPAAAALALLRRGQAVRRTVLGIVARNRDCLRRADPHAPVPAGPVYFDRTVSDGDRLAESCLRASVLVCPGSLFGDRRGVRVGLTRRSFPADLAAYLRVRRGLERSNVTSEGGDRAPTARSHRAPRDRA